LTRTNFSQLLPKFKKQKGIMIAIFEIIGALTRYLFSISFYKITGGKKSKEFSNYMNDKKGQIFSNLTNDYINGIVGFLIFSLTLLLLYIIFK
jgi:hypothetical protein